ncbi:hypothetical protein EYZ11_000685 [Aspergillus tanneri]|uniref:Large ribosomal subunit protein bL34m n=1 Tax=Aspergillus tanneri TaxID=1220188 RepID=A0A4S3JWX5_9EURO|nr:uncharacterized protein ATNIH1004_004977 [Aspergillus tanneri]KAA8649082.1 hypothetical protein ATNIH1004_004977 [Aspergillus tanneri]THC99873.1 hypothetical protein EYZ11_000685 [Aspergillus tanneri]
MLCLRCSALPSALRMFASSALTRPSLSPLSSPLRSLTATNIPSIHAQPPSLASLRPLFPNHNGTTSALQTRSFSASASLGVKRDTYNPSRRVQKRRHGFLARLRSRGGRKILMRRRAKGRKNMSW